MFPLCQIQLRRDQFGQAVKHMDHRGNKISADHADNEDTGYNYRTTHPSNIHTRVSEKSENGVTPNAEQADHKPGGKHCTDMSLGQKA